MPARQYDVSVQHRYFEYLTEGEQIPQCEDSAENARLNCHNGKSD